MSIESRARRRARQQRIARRQLKVAHFLGQPAPGYARMKRAEDARKDALELAVRDERAKRRAAAPPPQEWTVGPILALVLIGVVFFALILS